jgi:competence protein ComEA
MTVDCYSPAPRTMPRPFLAVALVTSLALATAAPAAAQTSRKVDINSASSEALKTLPGIDDASAQKIIEGRPYRGTSDLERKRVLPRPVYDKIAIFIVARPTGGAGGAGAPRREITERDLPALAAKQHPGQKWGYLKVFVNANDTTGDVLVVKVPDTARDGELVTIAITSGAMNAATKDLFTQVRGHVRRGQGTNGTDILEVTGVWHRANPNLARRGSQEFAAEGWRTMRERLPLTH